MSSKSGYPRSHQPDIVGNGMVFVAGAFTLVNDAAPTVREGTGWTVARTSEGIFTVTFRQAFMAAPIVVASLARETLPTEDTRELTQAFVDQDTLTTTGFAVNVYYVADLDVDAGPPTNVLDDDPGSEIHFIAVGRYSSLKY